MCVFAALIIMTLYPLLVIKKYLYLLTIYNKRYLKPIYTLVRFPHTTISMSKPNKNTANSSNNTKAIVTDTATKLPGVNNTQVIPSSPDFIKENSYKIKKK